MEKIRIKNEIAKLVDEGIVDSHEIAKSLGTTVQYVRTIFSKLRELGKDIPSSRRRIKTNTDGLDVYVNIDWSKVPRYDEIKYKD
jgi:transcription initiation factor IIE alpha subunit